LTEEESKQYIDHHLRLVGSRSSEVFTPEAISLICHQAKGIPQIINFICDKAFSVGYQRSRKRIDSLIVREAFRWVYKEEGRYFGVWAFGGRLVTREIPYAARKAFSRVYEERKRLSGVWAFGERLATREIPYAARKAFTRGYEGRKRLSGVWAFGRRLVIREIPYAARKAFTRGYEERKRLSGVWAFGRNFLSKPAPYFAPVIICLVLGIFLGKDFIMNLSEKTVAHLIVPQKAIPPIFEREIEELAKISSAPSLGKTKEKVSVPAREKNTNIFTSNSRPQDLERTEPMTEPLSTAEKATPLIEKKIEEPSLKNATSALGKIEPIDLPDPSIANRKAEPPKLGAKKVFQAVPSIIYAFASKQIRPGDIWKVYLKASHPNGGMKYIFSIIEGAGSHLSIISIKEENREYFSGYIYLNTFGISNSPGFITLTLTTWIKDAAGHLSQPMVFPLELHNNINPEKPPKGLFEEQELGPIMIQLQSMTHTGG
jgi:hypothetical protein